MLRPSSCLAAVVTTALSLTAVADSERERREAELEELRERIEAVRERLAADRERRDDVSAELERIERRVGEIAGRVADLDRRIAEQRNRLDEIAAERDSERERLATHRETLGEQLRAAYRMGREPALRLLLRQDDPTAVARAMGYYGYFNDARLGAMDEVSAGLERLRELEAEAESTREALAADRDELDAEQDRLAEARAERADVLARVEERLDERGARLDELEADRERLRELLDDLSAAMDDIPDNPLEDEPFATRERALAWPVEGPLRATFGSERAGGRMRWRGLVIEAEAGTPVEAVYHGRVVFADWLSGFGQLVIVDHQEGYMSLYGYNERIVRSEGEWVEPGDELAVVGRSGAQDDPGLYFEIRHDGDPEDPRGWLRPR